MLNQMRVIYRTDSLYNMLISCDLRFGFNDGVHVNWRNTWSLSILAKVTRHLCLPCDFNMCLVCNRFVYIFSIVYESL